jgi:hypothetical protein
LGTFVGRPSGPGLARHAFFSPVELEGDYFVNFLLLRP